MGIFINQIRSKIGTFYGPQEVTAGGNALKYYSSVRLDIRKKEPIMNKGVHVGNKTRVKVVKNKVSPPFREAFFDIRFGQGIDKMSELFEAGLAHMKVSGSHYYLKDEEGTKLGNGKAQAVKML